MKAKFTQTLLLIISFLIYSQAQSQSWSAKTNFGGTARKDACGFAISNKGYVGTGDDGVRRKDLWEYNQNTDTWTQKADMPTASGRDKACGFAVGTKGYITCGNDGSAYLKDCYEYDPAGNTWTAKTDFPGTARQNATGYCIGAKGYVTCGYDGTDQKIDHYEFDPVGNSWAAKANYSGVKREKAVGFGCTNGKGYVGTGWDGSTRKRDWHEYNPATNTWTQKGDFAGTQRTDACGFSIGSKGYLGCGNDGTVKADFWEYNPQTDTWIQQPDYIGTARGKAVGLGIGSRGYIGTGEDANGRSKTWHEFKPCDTWERKADFPGTARTAAFGFAINGKGYMGTGYDGFAPETKDVWEYNPATDTWTQVADFGGTARHSTYSFQIGDKGYVGGGWDGGVNNNDLWEYDQPSNTWSVKASLPAAGRIEALGLAINGKGYVGTGNTGALQNDWYEYNPGTNSWSAKANFPGTNRSACAGFTIGNFGYMGTGTDVGGATKDFYRYNPATDSWIAVADCGVLKRTSAVGFTLCNKGYIVTGQDDLGNLLREFWEYDPVGNTWTQQIDYGGSARNFASAFVIGCSAYVGLGNLGIGINYSKELWEYRSCCCGGGSVSGGGGGGVESNSLGNIISQRLYVNAKNSKAEVDGVANGVKFIRNNTVVNGINDLSLASLVPNSVAGTDIPYVSTPTDLVNFTNAVEVLSVDYTRENQVKAVAFGTKTLGDVYAHTKPICDRLKGAELMEVKNVNVKGYNLIAYKVHQRLGQIEYAINLTAGTNVNRNSITLQSNWFTDSYVQDEKLYNFQLWAVSYDMVTAMAYDIISKLQANGVVNAVTNADLPKAYISKGSRDFTDLTLKVLNNTNITTGYFEMKEKANEADIAGSTRQVPFTIQANGISTLSVPVSDYYEGNVSMFLNNKLMDMVYSSDGTWDINYNKQATTVNQFSIVNESPAILSSNPNEYRLMRNVYVNATTTDYITIYKTMSGGGIDVNLTKYNTLAFNSSVSGTGSVTIRLIKKSIANYNEHYSYTMPLNGSNDYTVSLSQFKSSKYGNIIEADDITAVAFSFNNTDGGSTTMSVNLNKVRFAKVATAPTTPAEEAPELKISPNPAKTKFTATFNSIAEEDVVISIVELSTGRTIQTFNYKAKQGSNVVELGLNGKASYANGLYVVQVNGYSQNLKPAKLMINR